MIRAFGQAGGRRAVCAGSCAEYDWNHAELIEDETPLAPRTLYGRAKHAAHEMCAALAPSLGVSLAWGRIFFLYGPGEAPRRLVPDVVGALLRGQPADCTAGTQERDFLHVEDAARAFACALGSDFEGAFNVASGHCAPVRELVVRLGEACGRPELLRLGARPLPPGEPPRLAASVARLHGPIGFVPRYDLASGIAQTVAWWRTQPL